MSENYRSDTLPGLNCAWYTKYYSERNMCLSIMCIALNNFYLSHCIQRKCNNFFEKELYSLQTGYATNLTQQIL